MTDRPRFGSLIFEVTQRCNHACLHCYNVWQGPSSYPRGELDTARTLNLLGKALDETDCRNVSLTGGEPLLRSDLPALLEFLRRRMIRVTLISNGRMLSRQRTRALIEQGVGLFELPLLSPDRRMHDRLSAAPGAWDAVLEAMANIRLERGKFVAAFVATRLNIDRLSETIKLAFAFGARALMLNRFNPGGRGRLHLQDLLPSTDQVREAVAAAESASCELGMPIACSIPIQPCLIDTRRFGHVSFGYCAIGTEKAYYTLDPLGNVRACNHSGVILGNLLNETFGEIVKGQRLQEFRAALPPACSHCGNRLVCQGGCKAAAQACYGSPEEEEPWLAHAHN